MPDNVFVNRDRTAVVPSGSAAAKWQITRKEAKELGLLESDEKPVQKRRPAEVKPQSRRTSKPE